MSWRLCSQLTQLLPISAWLLRLAEITRTKGLVVIASKTGEWNSETLKDTLSEKG